MFSPQDSLRAYRFWLFLGGALSFGLFLVISVVYSIRSPEKLQSEAYQIQLKALEIVEQQARAKNLKQACLENAIREVIAPLLHQGSERRREVPSLENRRR